jgi:hypothetical protein
MGRIFSVGFWLIIFSASAVASEKTAVEQWTGKHTRVVWVQDQGKGADTFARGHQLMLYGYDSSDGRGERPLVPGVGNFFKPLFTPDGSHVVVSNRKARQMFLVEWETGKVTELGPGVAVEVWQEPGKSFFSGKPKTWVYFFSGNQPENKYGTSQPLFRFSLDSPERKERVWDKTRMAWSNMQLSQDGDILGGLFPWPHGGVLHLKDKKWQRFGRGCWTSLSPDNSKLLWIFDGLHRNVQIHDVENGGSWKVSINGADGVNGYEVYHPRWSNHPRFFVITGPYEKGDGGNRIGGGGERVEIFIGRFDAGAKSVQDWLQVTSNGHADFYPDLWIEGGEKARLTDAVPGAAVESDKTWPTATDSLLFVWENMKGTNQLAGNSPVGFRQCNIQLRGRALFSRNLQLMSRGGWGETGETGRLVGKEIARSGEMGLQLFYTPLGSHAILVSFLHDKEPIYRMVQDQADLVVDILTGNTLSVRWPGVFRSAEPVHLVLSSDGQFIELYRNGVTAGKQAFPLDFESFKESDLVLGMEGDTGGGLFENMAVYNRVVNGTEAAANYSLIRGVITSRKRIERLKIKAVLQESTEIPPPDSLGAYRRALVVNSYQVKQVLEGKYTGDRIVVAEWAVLDRKIIKAYPREGRVETLVLEKFDDHPELEGERQMMDIFEPDLDIYYRTDDNL